MGLGCRVQGASRRGDRCWIRPASSPRRGGHGSRSRHLMLDHPQWLFLSSLFVLWVSVEVGTYLRRRRTLKDEERQDFDRVQAACLTLLGLVIGFSFSMAISRYDLRKHYEADEANAIGTE